VLEWPGLVVGAYLLGGIPFGWLLVRLVTGTDVRSQGSGNVGATNAARAVPSAWRLPFFLLVFVLDAGKGTVAAAVLPPPFALGPGAPPLAGLAAVLGHSFSPYLRFRGGKAVATTLGVMAALEPWATAAAVAAFLAVTGLTRVVALGSLALALVLPVAVAVRGAASREVLLLSVALAALIVVRHRSNIARLLRGGRA
jgi:glycerol-3-phosphate acyltransferase PlsY